MGVINKTTEEINALLDKVQNMPEEGVVGKTPVLESGTTTTLDPGQQATSQVVRNGEDENGNPKYKINFGIPKGYDGGSSGGGGIADSVQWKNVLNKPSWVNSATKPSYTATEVGALPINTTIPSKTSQLTNDSGYTTSSSFKTINGQSIIGEGNIEVAGSSGGIADAPSDGKLYGRSNGNWTEVETRAINIADLMERISQSIAAQSKISQEDYNLLSKYAKDGSVLYIYTDSGSSTAKITVMDGNIYLEYRIPQGNVELLSKVIIDIKLNASTIQSTTIYADNVGKDGLLTDYSKPSSYSAITEEDTINQAIGKLEAGLSNGGGGSSSSDEFVIENTNINIIEPTDTSDRLIEYIGGEDNIQNIYNAIINGKKIRFTKKDSGIGFSIYVDSFLTFASIFSISFTLSRGVLSDNTTKNITLEINKSSKKVNITYYSVSNGYSFKSGLDALTLESTDEEVKSIIPTSSLEKIEALHKLGCKFNTTLTTGYFSGSKVDVFLNLNKTSEFTIIQFTIFSAGVFGGTEFGARVIYYEASSNTYSVIG